MFALVLVATMAGAEPDASLSFQRSSQRLAELTGAQISTKVAPQTVTFFDPFVAKTKSYRCWPVKSLMDAIYGPGWEASEYSEAILTALDGYASVSVAAKLAEPGGCLAFEDLDVPGWEPIGRRRSNPGPYYLVWTGANQRTEHEYPWPWQLASVNLVKLEERYPDVLPKGAAPGSSAARGFEIFKGRCLRCHAINQQGGEIGPDLNAPQSVATYRTKTWITEYVRQPSKYRYTQMPDHMDLQAADLDAIYEYLKLKSTQPEKRVR
ncbi:MAG: cytochrome C [Candidatus Rokuibacteriota bacterium]|nr:MAG: cytochrome C [Candidatus Rokubacteria bacterium]